MTYEQIETFLATVTYGNISEASKHLFVSQSTVSSRIQQLETELDTHLLVRNKGHRAIDLTTQGTSFIPIANRWASLWKETRNLKALENKQTITIASVDAINNSTFVPFFNQCIKVFPDIQLQISTHHSNEIHALVQNRTADIGYVFNRIGYPEIVSRPIFRELMYLICRKDSVYHEQMACEDLQPENEVFLNWGVDFQQWSDRNWAPHQYKLICVNTGSMLQHYLHEPGRWAVAPKSVINDAMASCPDLVFYKLTDPPPPRICYELTNRYPNPNHIKPINKIRKALEGFIHDNNNICSFERWMLAE